ncbi:unnamed protein product [Oikopleura dioica]|uniref:Uncharacterized protein n=1 Tax=Oikopleura dioica TaxID=34765 RepID=E4XRK3_OIKDI|nr:unnamed protein product [Oikopleura dioica]
MDRQYACLGNCNFEKNCFDACYVRFLEDSDQCPCMAGCEIGCPCSGYDCQPYLTAICQNRYSDEFGFSYVISSSGHFKENRYYTTPASTNDQFLYRAGHSILNGQVYIFGGPQNSKKIGKMEACAFEDTGKRLLSSFYPYEGSLATLKESSEKIILCNGYFDSKCESFDGDETVAIAETNVKHEYACMSINEQGRPTIIAGYYSSSVEILETSGWQNASSHPAGQIYRHTCASVPNGIVTVGGYISGTGDSKNVYLFRNRQWSVVGQMQNYQRIATMIAYDTFFIVFGGVNSYNSVERAEWDGNNVTSTQVINNHAGDCYYPIIFETAPDQCKEFCSENFCYDF